MKKILLVIDEYSELMNLQSLLKRVGFDVLSLNRGASVSEALLSFIPDLVLASQKGSRVDGIQVATQVRKRAPSARLVLIQNQNDRASAASSLQSTHQISDRPLIDAYLESPFDGSDIISICAQLLMLDAAQLLTKYEKLSNSRGAGVGSDLKIVSNTQQAQASVKKSERELGYDKFLQKHAAEKPSRTLKRQEMQAHMEALRKHENAMATEGDTDEIVEQKRAFALALLRHARGW